MKPVDMSPLPNPRRGLCFPALEVASQEDLFATLAGALAGEGIASHRDVLLKALLEREAVGTSAVGHGIAIPHVRSMVVETTAVAFARLPKGLDLAPPRRAPVHAVFLIVAPYGGAGGALYLPLLAVFAAASHDKAGRGRLLAVDSFESFTRLMSDFIRPQILEVMAR